MRRTILRMMIVIMISIMLIDQNDPVRHRDKNYD
jgi:hypothetical protein